MTTNYPHKPPQQDTHVRLGLAHELDPYVRLNCYYIVGKAGVAWVILPPSSNSSLRESTLSIEISIKSFKEDEIMGLIFLRENVILRVRI